MIGWMLASAAHAAEVWWVPDDTVASALRSALAADWPERPCEVVVGPRPDGGWGWTWDGGVLRVHTGQTERTADANEARVAVLFARTWEIRTESPGWERWLPAGTEPLVVDARMEPVEAIRAPPDPSQTPWSLGLGLGTRTMTDVPSLAPGLRLPMELVVGTWTVGADVAADPSPRQMGGGTGLVSGVTDLWSTTVRTGLRTRGDTFIGAGPAFQFRMAQPTLARGGFAVSTYQRPVTAGLLEVGIGHDLGIVRTALRAWVRSTYTLPVSAGVDLELLVFAHERRR